MRVGLIVPSSNPTIEAFLPAVAGVLGVSFLVTRIGVRRIAADPTSDAQFDIAGLASAAALLADAEVSLISWAGTAGFWLGVEREAAVLAAAAEVGVPVVSSRMAMMAALEEMTDPQLGVFTPYVADIHQRVVATLSDAGYVVAGDKAMGIERNLDFAAIPADVVATELRALAGSGATVLPLVCTNVLGTLPAMAQESALVLDSVLATLWDATCRVGATSMSYADCYRAVLAGRCHPEETQ
ncbi:MAG TPA: hypothetical protein VGL26_01215 [Jatrophihabitans sp.]|jgi:maleate isomerase